MTIRTIKTNPREADAICGNTLSVIFRSDKEFIQPGDVIQFLCMKEQKPITHKINSKGYVVTKVYDAMTAPVVKGYQAVTFRAI